MARISALEAVMDLRTEEKADLIVAAATMAEDLMAPTWRVIH
jgi:hypothetical protein